MFIQASKKPCIMFDGGASKNTLYEASMKERFLPKHSLVIIMICFFLGDFSVTASPLFALKVSNECGACHTPGRTQRPVLERRCTLDCQGCHIDPSGAGPRNQWGAYFLNDQLATVNFIKPQDPLDDTSRFDVHVDSRYIQRQVGNKQKTFPMATEFSLRIRPLIYWLHLSYQGVLLGRAGDGSLRNPEKVAYRYQEKYSLMIDQLPLNLYVRAFRGPAVYGLRHSNHSRWIRERIGLNQFALIDGVAFGGTPTVPFFHFSVMQGDPQVAEENKQHGSSFHGGFRGVTAGWHLNLSYWKTKSKKSQIEMKALGGGLKILDLVLMGEKNWRDVTAISLNSQEQSELQDPFLRVHPSSVISDYSVSYVGIGGVIFGVVLEELVDDSIHSLRKSIFLDLHPVPYLQLEYWYRQETGDRDLEDQLALIHTYFDF